MSETPDSAAPATDEPVRFPRLSRWLDMLDEALEIGTHRPQEN
jgi:hypothetical protein